MLNDILVVLMVVFSFIGGLALDNWYHTKASRDQKEALEKQFVRLRAKMDYDDPCKPYGSQPVLKPIPVKYNTGDFDGDGPIGQTFMNELKTQGRAKTAFRKSDIAK